MARDPSGPQHDLPSRPYTVGEEIANAVTHGLGWVGSVVGLVALIALAVARRASPLHVASLTVYGATMVLLYIASTMYHALTDPRAKRVFRIIDHSSIYLLIAGSYTPFTLINLRGPWGFTLFGLVWGIAVLGILSEALWKGRPKWLNALLYLGMGWIVIFAIRPLVATMAPGGIWLLGAGGLTYTVGTIFYAMRVRYLHTVFHLFVLAGSLLHFLCVLFYVLPKT